MATAQGGCGTPKRALRAGSGLPVFASGLAVGSRRNSQSEGRQAARNSADDSVATATGATPAESRRPSLLGLVPKSLLPSQKKPPPDLHHVETLVKGKLADLEVFFMTQLAAAQSAALPSEPEDEEIQDMHRSGPGMRISTKNYAEVEPVTMLEPIEEPSRPATTVLPDVLAAQTRTCDIVFASDHTADSDFGDGRPTALAATCVRGAEETLRESEEPMVDNCISINKDGAEQKQEWSSTGRERSSEQRNGSKVLSTQRRENFLKEVVRTFSSRGDGPPPTRNGIIKRKGGKTERAVVVMDSIFSMVILLNAMTIGVSTDLQPDWLGWIAIDGFFAFAFSVEMVIKMILQKRKYVTGPDRFWNLFEAGMVAFGIFETIVAVTARISPDKPSGSSSNLALLRILRLARISRLLRVCRMPLFTELKIMIQGAFGGFRTLMWSTVLICLPLYAASILFRETLGIYADRQHGAEMFHTVARSFHTLFRCTVSNECSTDQGRPIFSLVAQEYGWVYSMMFCCLELFMVFGLFNVIVAIFIENVLASAKTNDLVMQRERIRNKQFFAQKMMEFVDQLIQAGAGCSSEFELMSLDEALESNIQLTPEMLDQVLKRPAVVEIIRDLDLAEADMLHMVDILDLDGSGDIDMAELFEGISRLRGQPSRSDVVGLSFMLEQVQEELSAQKESLKLLSGHMTKVEENTCLRGNAY